MCGICSTLGVDIHDIDLLDAEPKEFNLDAFPGLTFRGKTIATLDRVVQQIDSGLSMTSAADGVITWGFYDANRATGLYNSPKFNGEGEGYTPFTDAQREAARTSIQLWDDLIKPSFEEVSGPGASERNKADILLANTSTGPAQAWAYYPIDQKQYKKLSSDAWIADPVDNWTNAWFTPGGYGTTTLVHELGHSLGLSHPGAYNGAGATNYAGQAEYAQDSMQYSIMSYWSGQETNALTVNWSLFLTNYAQTPMLHDIYVIQQKYGADPTTRTGDTVYGFNSTAGRDVFDFSKNPYPYLAIYDAGGANDTIDLSGFTVSQFVNLQPGSFSSVGAAAPTAAAINANRAALNAESGSPLTTNVMQATVDSVAASFMNAAAARIGAFTGVAGITATSHDNLSIAYGTIIENAIGGSARDLLWGNDVANRLEGRGGNDVLNGFAGNDTLLGGQGNDTLIGGAGADVLYGNEGNDVFEFGLLETGDRIMDWNAGDRIDLTRIDADSATAGNQAFAFIGDAAFGNVAGQLRYKDGLLQGDVNGDGIADFQVALTGAPGLLPSAILL